MNSNSQHINNFKQFISNELNQINHSIERSFNLKNKTIGSVLNDLKIVNINLIPILIEVDGFKNCLENLIIENPFRINFPINIKINYSKNTLSKEKELILYQIIFEALSNISKHAKANYTEVKIEENENKLFVEIADNGKGFPIKHILLTGNAFGLKKIMDNCNLLKTSAFINSSEKGTKISFHIPLKNGI